MHITRKYIYWQADIISWCTKEVQYTSPERSLSFSPEGYDITNICNYEKWNIFTNDFFTVRSITWIHNIDRVNFMPTSRLIPLVSCRYPYFYEYDNFSSIINNGNDLYLMPKRFISAASASYYIKLLKCQKCNRTFEAKKKQNKVWRNKIVGWASSYIPSEANIKTNTIAKFEFLKGSYDVAKNNNI